MHYQCEYVKCGKPRCKGCPHGPYWYGYWRDGKKVKKKYFGKKDPREAEPHAEPRKDAPPRPAAQANPLDDIFSRRTATREIAYRILKLDHRPVMTWDEVSSQARRLLMDTHPDRGGDTREFQRVNAAFSYLKSLR